MRSIFSGCLGLVFLLGTNLAADERKLDVKKAERLEIRQSMIGYRDTLLFYTFSEERVVVVLRIGNGDETFPVSGRVHFFANGVAKEKLAEWVNNQHSDGLFVDVPEPESVVDLPMDVCLVTEFKRMGESENHGPERVVHVDYEVVVSVKEYGVENKFKLAAFEESGRVHVKKK